MYRHLLWKYIYIWTFISRKNEKERENKEENSSRNNSHLYIEKHVVLFTTGTTCPPPILKELGRFLKCTVIGRGAFGPCACCGHIDMFYYLDAHVHSICLHHVNELCGGYFR